MIFMHKVVDVYVSEIRVSPAATGYQQKTDESNWLEMKSIKGLKKAPSGSLGHVDFLAGQVTLKQVILYQNHKLR